MNPSGSLAKALAISFTQGPQSLFFRVCLGTRITSISLFHSIGGTTDLPKQLRMEYRFGGIESFTACLSVPLTLEIPVYETLFRGSERFADVRNVTLGKKIFRVPKPQEW